MKDQTDPSRHGHVGPSETGASPGAHGLPIARRRSADLTQAFKAAMAEFPSGVTIVTTTDNEGSPRGFTATAFTSVSAEPPLVLSCLAKSAQCFSTFEAAEKWVVHVIADGQADLAMTFATRGADKFPSGSYRWLETGMPALHGAPVVLECSAYARHDGGDHVILVGRVDNVVVRSDSPAIYYQRAFRSLRNDPIGASA